MRSSVSFSPTFIPSILDLGNRSLTIGDIIAVARNGQKVAIGGGERMRRKLRRSQDLINEMVEKNEPIYGVTTGFGGMAHTVVSREQAADLQNNLLWFLKSGAGGRLPEAHIRAAMLVRANALVIGVSGVRYELVERFQLFLNEWVTPHVCELGSIGASGDLVPLSAIAGALVGLDDSFRVEYRGKDQSSISVLKELGVPPLRLLPKEGLALVNGTAVMTGIAACCLGDLERLLVLTLGVHALYMQALNASNQPFHAFIHKYKPHPGQQWIAESMLGLLDSSEMVKDEITQGHRPENGKLIQDRYSIRCLPQFLGPIAEGIAEVCRQIEIEANSATDNPLIDVENRKILNGGNFLGQYVGLGMDRVRNYIGLLAKHLDTQIALLVAPEFSNGLPASLIGNSGRAVNMGLKGLQLTGNSIMPLLTFLGNSFVPHFPTHAEQFNQNINSLGFGAATLTSQSIGLFKQYLSVALIFGVQAVDLRAFSHGGRYDARNHLSPETLQLYEAVKQVVGRSSSSRAPFIYDDNEQALDVYIKSIAEDLDSGGRIYASLADYHLSFEQFKAKMGAPRLEPDVFASGAGALSGREDF